MEQYLAYSKAFLGIIQSVLSEEEKKNSAACAQEIYDAIKPIIEKYNLNIAEMLNATLAVNTTIVQLALEQLEDRRDAK